MKKAIFGLMILSFNSFAADGFQALSQVGEIYKKTSGPCAAYLDNMKWGVAQEQGVISFAETNTPKVRPLTGYVKSITISAVNMRPLGEGEFTSEFNQPVPVKAEFDYEGDDLKLYVHHKGKGAWGDIWGNPGYSGANEKYEFRLSDKNEKGQYKTIEMAYQNLKGLVNGKKQLCRYTLE